MALTVGDRFGHDAATARISEGDAGRGEESATPGSRLVLDDVNLVAGAGTDVHDRQPPPTGARHQGVPAGRPG